MITPAVLLILDLCRPKKPMISLLFVLDMIVNSSSGIAIPIPNSVKFKLFSAKSAVDELSANNTVKDAGLQGSTMAPKKKPNRNELQ